jgi:hypothetical protein
MNPLLDRLRQMCTKPGMYFGGPYTWALSHWLHGYREGLEEGRLPCDIFGGWRDWVQMRYEVYHTAWHWVRILQHAHGSDAAALAAVPELYEQFLRDRERWGVEGIERRMKEAIRKRYGEDYGEPRQTRTHPRTGSNPTGDERP